MKSLFTGHIGWLVVLCLAFVCGSCTDDHSAATGGNVYIVELSEGDETKNYEGLTLQFGEASSTQVLGSATFDAMGMAGLPIDVSAYVGKKIWFCVPNVVKFFHTLTAAEAEEGRLVLPDKDGGCTLPVKTDIPAAGGRYGANDWMIALYMGINKSGNSGTPIYWATGNLIAIKTTGEGEATLAAYRLSTMGEMRQEATADSPDFVDTDERIVTGVPDAYVSFPAGTQWDTFAYGDPSGLMLYEQGDDSYLKFVTDVGHLSGGNTVFEVSGTQWDIATVQLGGTWRTATGGKTINTEWAGFEDHSAGFEDLQPNGVRWIEGGVSLGYKYEYVVDVEGRDITVNTLYLPAVGYRHAQIGVGRGSSGWYWSSTADPTCTPPYVPGAEFPGEVYEYTTAFNYGYTMRDANSVKWYPHPRVSGQAIRPVTE